MMSAAPASPCVRWIAKCRHEDRDEGLLLAQACAHRSLGGLSRHNQVAGAGARISFAEGARPEQIFRDRCRPALAATLPPRKGRLVQAHVVGGVSTPTFWTNPHPLCQPPLSGPTPTFCANPHFLGRGPTERGGWSRLTWLAGCEPPPTVPTPTLCANPHFLGCSPAENALRRRP